MDVGGKDLSNLCLAEERVEVLVQIQLVDGQAGGFDVPGGGPTGVVVLGEGDLAAAVVVLGAVADLDLCAVAEVEAAVGPPGDRCRQPAT